MAQSYYQPQCKRAVELLSMTIGILKPTFTVSFIKYTLLGDSEELMSIHVLVHVCGCMYTHLIYLAPIFNDFLLHFTLPIVVCLGSKPFSISNFAKILRGYDLLECLVSKGFSLSQTLLMHKRGHDYTFFILLMIFFL